jgi:hypothetical protein
MTSLIFRPAVKLPTPDDENSEAERLATQPALRLRIFGDRVRHAAR